MRKGRVDVYLKASSGAGTEQPLLESPTHEWPLDWSKDGLFLLYYGNNPKTGGDLLALPMAGDERKPIIIANTAFMEQNGQFSPDGRWVAYQTNQSRRFEIVVQPFPNPSGKWQVSTDGGIQPRWRADGKELYFIAPDLKMMAAPIQVSGSSLEVGSPVALFQTRVMADVPKQEYAVSAKGRFLVNQSVEESTTTPITLILNWKPKTQ